MNAPVELSRTLAAQDNLGYQQFQLGSFGFRRD